MTDRFAFHAAVSLLGWDVGRVPVGIDVAAEPLRRARERHPELDLRQMSALKSALIYRRIARHTARQILFSLPHWLATNGHAGLLLVIDIRRLGVARRPPVEERAGQYYTRLGLLDAYEVLRQLVDSTDELARCCVVVIAAPELLTDESRGLDAYQALKLRIFDEIRDRRRDNPFSSLVRIGREETVS